MHQLTRAPGIALNYPVPSPDGQWLGGTNPNTREQFIIDLQDPAKAPDRLPAPAGSASAVYLNDWSPDGTRIPGQLTRAVSICRRAPPRSRW